MPKKWRKKTLERNVVYQFLIMHFAYKNIIVLIFSDYCFDSNRTGNEEKEMKITAAKDIEGKGVVENPLKVNWKSNFHTIGSVWT